MKKFFKPLILATFLFGHDLYGQFNQKSVNDFSSKDYISSAFQINGETNKEVYSLTHNNIRYIPQFNETLIQDNTDINCGFSSIVFPIMRKLYKNMSRKNHNSIWI